MKKNKEKEKNTNPYHKEYGVFSNSIHALKSMLNYSHRFIPVIIISIICAPIMQYLWSFISKFVIDMITSGQSVTALALLMGGFTVIQITATMLNLYGNSFFHIYIGARFRQMGLKNRKIMSVDYGYLEDKDFMDCYQKAGNACNSNNEGIEGMMRGIVRLLTLIPIIVVGIAILGTMNIFIVIAILICSVLQFVVTNKTNAYCKKKVWDPLAPWWRRHNYLSYTTSDFEAAKDIRMFGIADWLTEKFKVLNKERYAAQKKNSRIWAVSAVINAVLWAGVQAAVYAWLLYSVVTGSMTIGNFTLYLASSMTFFDYTNQLLNAVSDLLARSREYDDFRSFMDADCGDKDDKGIDVPQCDSYEFTFRMFRSNIRRLKSMHLKTSISLLTQERGLRW